MRNARGLHKPQATSEHDLHTKRFANACSGHWYLPVPSTMKIATSRGLLQWLAGHRTRFGPLCGLVASGHIAFACRWHVHSTAHTWNKTSASSVLVGARTHIELTWPNGVVHMVAVGHHVRHNNKPVHGLNCSGGDDHLERAACFGDLTFSLERYLRLCWHSDPSLDGERRKGARCRFHLHPHGGGENAAVPVGKL